MTKIKYQQKLRVDKYSTDTPDRGITCLCCLDSGLIPEHILNRYVEFVPDPIEVRNATPLMPTLLVDADRSHIGYQWPLAVPPMLCSARGCTAGYKWYAEDGKPNADASLTCDECTWIASEERKRWADEAIHESGKVADMDARRAILQASAAIGREMPAAPPPPEPVEAVAVGDDIGWEDW